MPFGQQKAYQAGPQGKFAPVGELGLYQVNRVRQKRPTRFEAKCSIR